MIWSFIIFQGIFVCVTIFAAKENRDSRSAYFTTRKNKQLVGHVVKQFESPSFMSCSQSCLRNSWCTSTNFRESSKEENEGTCELNNNEIAPVNQDPHLIDQPGVTFSMFLKGCLMTGCFNGGSCLFDKKKETFTCSCELPWSGDECEVKKDIHYHFTSLGAKGRFGPTSNKQYQGTSLDGVLVQNGLQTWNVPLTGQYHLELCGATGADHDGYYTKGGRGARVKGSIHINQGTKLTVLVGQKATGGGGGGGTFVVFADDGSPLAIAGGGGSADNVNGDPGQAGDLGSVNGGGKGKGGKVCVAGGSYTLTGVGGGGGLLTNGRCFVPSSCNQPCTENDGGKSFSAGGVGGYNKNARCAGGFGGGGNCGGGGGYSGGGVQVEQNIQDLHAGGGGSFVLSGEWTAVSGDCPVGDAFASFKIVSLDY